MYDKSKTIIKSRNDTGVEITILRGVKQGDPLSPLLFNLCLEPLLETIEKKTSGINISETNKVPVLAFADDVVLLGADVGEAQRQVDTLNEYLSGLDMTISRNKSSAFQIFSKRDTWFVAEPKIKLGDNTIPTIEPSEAFRYLGAKMGHNSSRASWRDEEGQKTLTQAMPKAGTYNKVHLSPIRLSLINKSAKRQRP
jgi:hypothetical protein